MYAFECCFRACYAETGNAVCRSAQGVFTRTRAVLRSEKVYYSLLKRDWHEKRYATMISVSVWPQDNFLTGSALERAHNGIGFLIRRRTLRHCTWSRRQANSAQQIAETGIAVQALKMWI